MIGTCLRVLGPLLLLWVLAGAVPAVAQPGEPGLRSFRSDAELAAYLRRMIADRESVVMYPPPPPPAPPPPPPPSAPPPPGSAITTASPAAVMPGITNNQVAGADEGGIVKLSGDHLVVLRRGRLFTVSLADRRMRPISTIDAFPPGVDASRDWYDEMLISEGRVIVIGYSYGRGGTQVNRFRLSPDGRLAFEDSYHLRSDDYYSAENYATRLVGNRLYLYTPLSLGWDEEGNPLDLLPGLRRWEPRKAYDEDDKSGFRRLASASRVFVPQPLFEDRKADIDTLHSVYDCDIAAPVMDCAATVVLGSEARTFFVSANAVYLWVSDAWRDAKPGANAFLYRVPLDRGRPSAVGVRGQPIDQFSFHPDPGRSALQVLVAAEGGGDAMWNPEVTEGALALVTVPMGSFGDGSAEVPLSNYTPLPRVRGNRWGMHNRFVGDHLLYAAGSGDRAGDVTVVSLADRSALRLPLAHGVDRIDRIGPDAVVVGTGPGMLGFTAVRLDPVALGESFSLPNARQGETRSHAFFFRPDPGSSDGRSGLLGLPVARAMTNPAGAYLGNSAGILFLARREGALREAGQLDAANTAGASTADGCVASCTDWYGNARPIFAGDRIFALLGYELVEGAERRGRISEVGRADFAPEPRAPAR